MLGTNTLAYFVDEERFCNNDCNENQRDTLGTHTLAYFAVKKVL